MTSEPVWPALPRNLAQKHLTKTYKETN